MGKGQRGLLHDPVTRPSAAVPDPVYQADAAASEWVAVDPASGDELWRLPAAQLPCGLAAPLHVAYPVRGRGVFSGTQGLMVERGPEGHFLLLNSACELLNDDVRAGIDFEFLDEQTAAA